VTFVTGGPLRKLTCAVLFLAATSAAADPLTDVRSALGRLQAREPIRATVELQRSVNNEGKLGNEKSAGKVAVEIDADSRGVRVLYGRPLLEQIEREAAAKRRDPKQDTPVGDALRDIDALSATEAVDFAPKLLRLMEGATVKEDRAGTFGGKPVRVVILRLVDDPPESSVGKVTVLENKLTLWLAPDHMPIAGEHSRQVKFSVLVIKGEAKSKESWHFNAITDRLIPVRHEVSSAASGLGSKGQMNAVATVRVH
jgi:hypothetical protein